jgi:hypothetical protein
MAAALRAPGYPGVRGSGRVRRPGHAPAAAGGGAAASGRPACGRPGRCDGAGRLYAARARGRARGPGITRHAARTTGEPAVGGNRRRVGRRTRHSCRNRGGEPDRRCRCESGSLGGEDDRCSTRSCETGSSPGTDISLPRRPCDGAAGRARAGDHPGAGTRNCRWRGELSSGGGRTSPPRRSSAGTTEVGDSAGRSAIGRRPCGGEARRFQHRSRAPADRPREWSSGCARGRRSCARGRAAASSRRAGPPGCCACPASRPARGRAVASCPSP